MTDLSGDSERKRASLKEGAAFGGLSFGINAVLALVSSILTARLFGVEVVGLYALALAPYLTLIPISTVSEHVGFVRFVAKQEHRAREVTAVFLPFLSFSFLLTTVMSLPLGLAGVALFNGPIDAPGAIAPALAILGSYLVLENVSRNLDYVMSGFGAGKELMIVRMAQSLALIVGLVATVDMASVWGPVVATIASWIVAFVVRIVLVRRFMVLRTTWAEVRNGASAIPEFVRFGWKITPASLLNGVSTQVGPWAIGFFGSIAAVGAFSRANNLAVRLTDAGYRISEVLYPSLVRRLTESREAFRELSARSVRYTVAAMAMVAAVGGGAASGVMAVFGPEFKSAGLSLALLLGAFGANVIALVAQQILVAEERTRPIAIGTGLRVVLIGLLIYPFGSASALNGVAAAICIGCVADTVWRLVSIAIHHGARLRSILLDLVRLCLASAAGAGSAMAVLSAGDTALLTLLALAVGSGAYVLVAVVAGTARPSEKRAVLNKLRVRTAQI
jgi:O-antigen/teichoic acid export membrane protein